MIKHQNIPRNTRCTKKMCAIETFYFRGEKATPQKYLTPLTLGVTRITAIPQRYRIHGGLSRSI